MARQPRHPQRNQRDTPVAVKPAPTLNAARPKCPMRGEAPEMPMDTRFGRLYLASDLTRIANTARARGPAESVAGTKTEQVEKRRSARPGRDRALRKQSQAETAGSP